MCDFQGLSRFMVQRHHIKQSIGHSLGKQGLIMGFSLFLAGCAYNADPVPKKHVSVAKNHAALRQHVPEAAKPKAPVVAEIVTKTKFKSGKSYGTASERVVRSALKDVPRGGGRAVVGKPYKINGRWYKPRHQPRYNKTGIASWYGPNFHGRKTANGEIYDQTALSAAHPTLPLPSYVRVTNVRNNRSVIVRVNDRGPFHKNRIIDLSYRTAELLGTRAGGIAKVKVKYIGRARVDGQDEDYLLASYKGPGSVEPSRIAARNKLLTYAGLSPDHDLVHQESVTAAAPPPVPSPIQKANPVIAANNQVAPIQSPTVISNQNINLPAANEPLILKPKTFSPSNPTHVEPARLIKANPKGASGANAYVAQNLKASDIEKIFDKFVKAEPADWQVKEPQFHHVGIFESRQKVMEIKDRLSRFGTVNLTSATLDGAPAIRVDLESRLPFAESAIQQIVPNAVILQ